MFTDNTCKHGVSYAHTCFECVNESVEKRACWTTYFVKSPYWCTVPLDAAVCKQVKREKFEDFKSSCVDCVYYDGKSG